MNVRILKVATDELTGATIRNGQSIELPSIQMGWRFNFGSRLKELSYSKAFVLVSQETPDIIEGCLIYQMKGRTLPYMAYLEIAPHNRMHPKKYDYIAGCLIAFACKQSIIHGKEWHQGWLTFDVFEEDPREQIRLMSHYSRKYKAQRFSETTMLISPEDGENLIKEYLERKGGKP